MCLSHSEKWESRRRDTGDHSRAIASPSRPLSRQKNALARLAPAIAGAAIRRGMPRKAAPSVQPNAAAAGGKYWLLKTEPGEWSWSDQARAPGGVGPWDGVRNRQAINSLRAMRDGDRCLFYHSGAGAASRRVVGVVEVAREWYEGEEVADGGGAVDVRAVGEFQRPVALGDIKKAAGEVEGMREFPLLRQPRLSVMAVPAKVWDWICEMGGGFVQDGEDGDEK
ncbi:LOW QUALITY PROTEIN: thymocyte nuclear protein 1 [Oryza brachyantha]|uniref:LOW QUALITY PROTEIN: thymocyte nuclear protein 1 n=1 Tax=Oryza brachyantha TaxID=4533 RepID=UPI001ADB58A1|nr:LOW QUALITY PROTEIN: thymocyte nuclear protein 1 [Oryza brachyantha]